MTRELKELTKPELLAAGEMFGSDTNNAMNKAELVKQLETDGVTYDDYMALVNTASEAVEPEFPELEDGPLENAVKAPDKTDFLLKMTRKNFTYQIRGYQFTRQHPFALVSEDDADYLIEEVGGFRPATPKELAQFYGN
jgi:hypothetical protein